MARHAPKITQHARIAIEKWREYFKENIDLYHEMHTFILGRQWDDDEEETFVKNNKRPLQFNKLCTLANTLLGEQQQNTPQIEVAPKSTCDAETAQIRQNIVKDTMMSTDAKRVYQCAAKQAIIGGFGAFIVDTDYSSKMSFDQNIVYRPIKDATKCYWDVGAEHPNKIDGMRAGYIVRMSRQKFRQMYGKNIEEKILAETGSMSIDDEEVALSTDTGSSQNPFAWADETGITLVYDYVRKHVPEMLYKLSNGKEVNQQELDEIIESSRSHHVMPEIDVYAQPENEEGEAEIDIEEQEMIIPDDNIMTLYDDGQPVSIANSKRIKKSVIVHRLMAGDYILEETEFPSENLPVIFMDQNSYFDVNGKQVCMPFFVHAVDAQRYLNYLGTQCAYLLKISRWDQWIGSKKNVQAPDTQQAWKDPSVVKGMLTYDESPSGAKPEQVRPPEISASLMEQYQRAQDDMYTSTGLYPTRLGQVGNEVSGAAIDSRTRQGSYPTFVVFNAINMAITAGGTIVNEMIPRVYDTQRVISLMTADRGRQNIVINESLDDYGEKVRNDVRKGEFEVILQAGPSYEGQKAQALESIQIALKNNPATFNLVADLFAENLPLINTIELKNRLKTLVPPEILEAGKTGQMPQQAHTPNAQDQAAMAEVKFKEEQIRLKQQELEIKRMEQQAMIQKTAMEIEIKKLELAAELEESQLRYMAETDRTRSDNAISHANNLTRILTSNTNKQGREYDR